MIYTRVWSIQDAPPDFTKERGYESFVGWSLIVYDWKIKYLMGP
jgi:hypothetical protein